MFKILHHWKGVLDHQRSQTEPYQIDLTVTEDINLPNQISKVFTNINSLIIGLTKRIHGYIIIEKFGPSGESWQYGASRRSEGSPDWE